MIKHLLSGRGLGTGAVAALVLAAAVGLPTVASAQGYGVEYAKTKGGGLLLNKMELKQSPPDSVNSKREAVGMNGYALVFQHDYNVCLVKSTPGTASFTASDYRWCVNNEMGNRYQQIRKVIFEDGMLKCLDGTGKPIWASALKKDPYAKIIISPQGELMITNAAGAVYWSKR